MRLARLPTLPLCLCVALLGGCFYTPQDLREVGAKIETTRPTASRPLANCMARNLMNAGLPTTMLDGPKPESYEIVMGMPGTANTVIEVTPLAKGSAVTIWITPVNPSPEVAAEQMLKGC